MLNLPKPASSKHHTNADGEEGSHLRGEEALAIAASAF